MKTKTTISTLTLLAGCALAAPALAEPRESATFEAVISNGPLNDAANSVRTQVFTGGYAARKIRVSGTLAEIATTTFASEARIQVTTPSGQIFVLQPFSSTGFTGTISVTDYIYNIPVVIEDAVGAWSFRFYESFDDGGVATEDSRWNTITLTLDDAAPVARPEYTSADDLGSISIGETINRTVNLTGADFPQKWFKFSVPAAVPTSANVYLDIDTNGSTGGMADTEIGLFDASGILIASDDDDGLLAQSLLSFGTGGDAAAGAVGQDRELPAGDYYLAVNRFNSTYANGWSVSGSSTSGTGTIQLRVRTGFLTPPPPPSVTDLGTLTQAGATVSDAALAAEQVQWFTFTLAEGALASATKFLDIDTAGSVLLPSTDTSIGLYDSTGARVDTNDDEDSDGGIRTSLLTWGTGSTGADTRRDGRDGDLTAGTYYLAVTGFGQTIFNAAGWSVTTEHTRTGTIDINILTNTGDPIVPPTASDLGTLTQAGAAVDDAAIAAGEVKWYKFTLAADALAATPTYLDIDTRNSLLEPATDTAIGLYSEAGQLIDTNDDEDTDASVLTSLLTWGAGSTGADTRRDGRDGDLTAGTYYLAVTGAGDTVFGASNWGVTTAHTRAGTIDVNLITNTGEPVNPPCPGDFNQDGFVDFFDYNDFTDCFDGVACPDGLTSDFNGDGFTDFFDVDDFVAAFEAGC
jgi:hypothetical protein